MTYRLSNAAASAAADAVVDLVDGGASFGTIKVYTGSAPAGPGSAATGTLLLTFTLKDPAYGSASNGVATLDVTGGITATGVAAGTAGWFRVADSNGTAVFDGTVGTDATFSTTSVTVGLVVQLTSGSYTQPTS